MKTFSLAQQIGEVDRELELRRRVYPGQVRSGAMRPGFSILCKYSAYLQGDYPGLGSATWRRTTDGLR
jgi:hypothetical protein